MNERKIGNMRALIYTAYDGTAYSGWQRQDNGISIEEKLNEALSDLFDDKIEVIGASRTDAGVHAEGAAAVFDCQTRMPAEKICYALNQRLPDDIRVIKSEQVADDFHPRHCESRKTYEYRIWESRFENPLNRLYTHHVHVPLNVDAMKEAAKYLIGEHDFTSFASKKAEVESFVREIYSISISEVAFQAGSSGREIRIEVVGNGFLYNMVRIIAGTLIEVGRGATEPSEVERILEARDREQAGPTAPAKGLTMKKIEFK